MRFHKYLPVHAAVTVLCVGSLPRLGAVLEVSVPQWTQASFVRFGVGVHCTLLVPLAVSLLVPLASVRLLMRNERQLFVHNEISERKTLGKVSGKMA